MTIIGTAIDNKEHLQLLKYPPVMTKHGLMQFIISGDQVPIHDTERTSGVYILGKPRMGKSWLIINMILQDHKQKKVYFLLIRMERQSTSLLLVLIRPPLYNL